MVPLNELLLFGGAALLMVLTPGPNMVYLVSRSICQGSRAGVMSLYGVVAGFLLHMLAAAIGVTALFAAVPFAYEALKLAGVGYLLYLAWQTIRPNGRSLFEIRELAAESPARLFLMGFMTNALNPKIAIFYMAVFPQFISAGNGSILWQSIQLGTLQILISFVVNLCIVLSAAKLAAFFSRSSGWIAAQRYVMGSVLAGLAIGLAAERRPG